MIHGDGDITEDRIDDQIRTNQTIFIDNMWWSWCGHFYWLTDRDILNQIHDMIDIGKTNKSERTRNYKLIKSLNHFQSLHVKSNRNLWCNISICFTIKLLILISFFPLPSLHSVFNINNKNCIKPNAVISICRICNSFQVLPECICHRRICAGNLSGS